MFLTPAGVIAVWSQPAGPSLVGGVFVGLGEDLGDGVDGVAGGLAGEVVVDVGGGGEHCVTERSWPSWSPLHQGTEWTFTARVGGGTRIGNTEVFDGTVIGLTKPVIASRWRRQFQRAVDTLASRAAQARR
ncbi:hypothetical protein [Kitasatospora sp. NPDC085879]|uniref:hypothetical protein n=1 Tax=Kitasatospora sp. NPDC085879 TaxID=3154769 RepID=UPI0034439A1E